MERNIEVYTFHLYGAAESWHPDMQRWEKQDENNYSHQHFLDITNRKQ